MVDARKQHPEQHSNAEIPGAGLRREICDPTKPFNDQIRRLIVSTHPSDGPIIVVPFGKRFKTIRDAARWKNYDELTGTDGIGTKGLLHWLMGTEQHGAQDVFAMVMDDLIEGGYCPYTFQDHILIQEEDQDRIFKITRALTGLAIENSWRAPDGKVRPIIISGGETAIINTLQGFEVGITGTGFVKRGHEIKARIETGDAILGLGSNGVHSNGLSFFRDELFGRREMSVHDVLPWGKTIGEELTRPTCVYLPAIKELLEEAEREAFNANNLVHGMVHITGGGLSKLRELMPAEKNLDIGLRSDHSLRPQEIFKYAHDVLGMPSEQMYKKFNNGIGYVIAVDSSFAKEALALLGRHFNADAIGSVEKGSGKVRIASQYEQGAVTY